MKKEFVSYEQAVSLKELGFDEDCFFIKTKDTGELLYNHSDYYDFPEEREAEIPTPLKQQVFRWFREKYCLYANLYTWIHEEEKGIYYEFDIYGNPNGVYGDGDFKTYEQAENDCIDTLISLAKQQDK